VLFAVADAARGEGRHVEWGVVRAQDPRK